MRSKTVSFKYSGFLLTRTLPILVLTGCIGLGFLGVLIWAGHEADRVSYDRRASLVQLVVSQLRSKVAHKQESVIVWDDAVERVRARDSKWMDNNLGARVRRVALLFFITTLCPETGNGSEATDDRSVIERRSPAAFFSTNS